MTSVHGSPYSEPRNNTARARPYLRDLTMQVGVHRGIAYRHASAIE
jgi:hypothetical protein